MGPAMSDTVYDDISEAIREDIAAGGGFREVSQALWPAMKPDSAYARLKNCLRDDKDDKLSPQEVDAIMRRARTRAGRSAIVLYACAAAQYDEPKPRDLDQERVEVQRQLIAVAAEFRKLLGQLESYGTQAGA